MQKTFLSDEDLASLNDIGWKAACCAISFISCCTLTFLLTLCYDTYNLCCKKKENSTNETSNLE